MVHVELANNIAIPSKAAEEFATLITAHLSNLSVILPDPRRSHFIFVTSELQFDLVKGMSMSFEQALSSVLLLRSHLFMAAF